MPVDPHIGAAALKELLFKKCRDEWAEVNYDHQLDIHKLQLSTADLIEITPPTDGNDDVDCLAGFLYKPSKGSNIPTFSMPKAPIMLILTMNSKDFTAYLKYFDEREAATANQTDMEVDELDSTDEVRVELVVSIYKLTFFVLVRVKKQRT